MELHKSISYFAEIYMRYMIYVLLHDCAPAVTINLIKKIRIKQMLPQSKIFAQTLYSSLT